MDFLLPHYLDESGTGMMRTKKKNGSTEEYCEPSLTSTLPEQTSFTLPSFMTSTDAAAELKKSSAAPAPAAAPAATSVPEVQKSKAEIKLANNVYCFDKDIAANVEMNSDYLYSRAVNYKKQGKITEAISAFEEFIALNIVKLTFNPSNSENHSEMHETVYQSYVHLGLIFSYLVDDSVFGGLKGKFEKVKSCYESAHLVCPLRAEPLFYLGIFCNKNKMWQDAVYYLEGALEKSFEKAVSAYPDIQATAYGKYIYQELGQSYAQLGKMAELLEVVKKVSSDNEMVQMIGPGVVEGWARAVFDAYVFDAREVDASVGVDESKSDAMEVINM